MHGLADLGKPVLRQHTASQLPVFGAQLVPRQGVLRIALGVADGGGPLAAILQLDDGPRWPLAWKVLLQFRITDMRDALHQRPHARGGDHVRRKLRQRSASAEQCHDRAERHAELCIDYGTRRVFDLGGFADNRKRGVENAQGHLRHLVGRNIVRCHECQNGINRCLHIPTAGVRFDRRGQDFKRLAQALRHPLGARRMGVVGLHKTCRALNNSLRAGKTLACQRCGNQPIVGRPAGVEAFCPGARGQKFHGPRCLAPRNTQRVRYGLRLQAPQTRHGRGSAKRATRAGGMKAALVMRLGANRHGQARRDLVAQHHGGQKLPTAHGLHLRGGNEG